MPRDQKKLWGGSGYRAMDILPAQLGKHGNEEMIGKYVGNKGGEYQKLHSNLLAGTFLDDVAKYPAFEESDREARRLTPGGYY